MSQILSWVLMGAAAAGGLMLLLWLIHFAIRNASIVDPGWAACIALIAVIYALQGAGDQTRVAVMTGMAVIWGLRLSLYLLFTRVIGHPEEGRYVQLRRDWKTAIGFKFLLFYEAQAVLAVALSLPFLLVARDREPGLRWNEYLGAALWAIAFLGETFADLQLNAFKRNPANKGRVCNVGLWQYSRHPNYFFEWLIWMAYAIFTLNAPYGYLALIMPAVMLFFLFKVTGIPATEEQSLRSRGDKYREYQRTTSRFVPWFPKRAKS
jgi:steroid 5-alpha reductase family enzyme